MKAIELKMPGYTPQLIALNAIETVGFAKSTDGATNDITRIKIAGKEKQIMVEGAHAQGVYDAIKKELGANTYDFD